MYEVAAKNTISTNYRLSCLEKLFDARPFLATSSSALLNVQKSPPLKGQKDVDMVRSKLNAWYVSVEIKRWLRIKKTTCLLASSSRTCSPLKGFNVNFSETSVVDVFATELSLALLCLWLSEASVLRQAPLFSYVKISQILRRFAHLVI